MTLVKQSMARLEIQLHDPVMALAECLANAVSHNYNDGSGLET